METGYSKIDSFKNYKPNWDGYGAEIPDAVVFTNSRNFLGSLPAGILSQLNVDNITLTTHGTIVFDWENSLMLISVEVGNSRIGFFAEDHISGKTYSSEGYTIFESYLSDTLALVFRD